MRGMVHTRLHTTSKRETMWVPACLKHGVWLRREGEERGQGEGVRRGRGEEREGWGEGGGRGGRVRRGRGEERGGGVRRGRGKEREWGEGGVRRGGEEMGWEKGVRGMEQPLCTVSIAICVHVCVYMCVYKCVYMCVWEHVGVRLKGWQCPVVQPPPPSSRIHHILH